MERLTAWSDYGAYFPKCYEEPCDGNGTENDCDNCGFMDDVCRKLAQYEDIGTLEEVRDAVERQKPKKVVIERWSPSICPRCGNELSENLGDGYYEHPVFLERCPNPDCAQRLDWSEEDEQ